MQNFSCIFHVSSTCYTWRVHTCIKSLASLTFCSLTPAAANSPYNEDCKTWIFSFFGFFSTTLTEQHQQSRIGELRFMGLMGLHVIMCSPLDSQIPQPPSKIWTRFQETWQTILCLFTWITIRFFSRSIAVHVRRGLQHLLQYCLFLKNVKLHEFFPSFLDVIVPKGLIMIDSMVQKFIQKV